MPEASTSTPESKTVAETKLNGQHVTLELDSIEDALRAIHDGECIVVVDDMDRENEGDLIMAASKCTTEEMAWIVRHSRWGYLFCYSVNRGYVKHIKC